jgi:hypothetical protein
VKWVQVQVQGQGQVLIPCVQEQEQAPPDMEQGQVREPARVLLQDRVMEQDQVPPVAEPELPVTDREPDPEHRVAEQVQVQVPPVWAAAPRVRELREQAPAPLVAVPELPAAEQAQERVAVPVQVQAVVPVLVPVAAVECNSVFLTI